MDNGYEVVDLSRISRKWATLTLRATEADGTYATLTGVDFVVLPYKATPQSGTVWTAAASFAAGPDDEDGTPTWIAKVLLAGPDASAAGALAVPAGTSDLHARVVDTQEIDVKLVARVRVK